MVEVTEGIMTKTIKRKTLNTFIFWLIVIAGLLLHFYKKLNLAFHTRDYQYYLVSFDSRFRYFFGETRKSLLHPEGFNIFGFRGTDGFPMSWVDIHFSPATFALSAIYQIGGELAIATIYCCIVAVSFIFFTEKLLKNSERVNEKMLILFSAFIILICNFSTHELRIWTPLIAFATLLIVAIESEWAAWKILSLSFILLMLREDSIFFIIIAAAHLIIKRRNSLGVTLISGAVVHSTLALLYFVTATQFHFYLTKETIIFFALPLAFLVASYATKYISSRYRNSLALRESCAIIIMQMFKDNALIIWSWIYFIPLWANLITSGASVMALLQPRYLIISFLIFSTAIIICKLSSKYVRVAFTFTAASILLFSIWTLRSALDPRKLPTSIHVWSISEAIDKESLIITTLSLHQAFWDHNAVVLDRLPAQTPRDADRYFPRNEYRLMSYIENAEFLILDLNGKEKIEKYIDSKFRCEIKYLIFFCERLHGLESKKAARK